MITQLYCDDSFVSRVVTLFIALCASSVLEGLWNTLRKRRLTSSDVNSAPKDIPRDWYTPTTQSWKETTSCVLQMWKTNDVFIAKHLTCSMFSPPWGDKLYRWLLWLQQGSGQQLHQVTKQQKWQCMSKRVRVKCDATMWHITRHYTIILCNQRELVDPSPLIVDLFSVSNFLPDRMRWLVQIMRKTKPCWRLYVFC